MKLYRTIVPGIAVVAIAAVAGIFSLQAREYGMAGCGLGSLILKEDKVGPQIGAAFLNATGVQTSGITTGTSNCVDDGVAFQKRKQEYFVTVNFESLQQEMAVGQGEKLISLASLLGCPAGDFGKMTRKEYSGLFPANVTPDSLIDSVRARIANDKTLSNACQVKA